MKLYHGSPTNFSAVKKSQAQQGEGMNVPADELLDAIYLTPQFEFGLAVAAMPEGAAHIDDDNHTIEFENPELFDPNKQVYMYEFDTELIPPKNLKYVDEKQYAIVGMEELIPVRKTVHEAREITEYYRLTNWKGENSEQHSERRLK